MALAGDRSAVPLAGATVGAELPLPVAISVRAEYLNSTRIDSVNLVSAPSVSTY